MVIERILAPVHALGPGERIGIWTRGCKKDCPGCMSTDLQDAKGNQIGDAQLAKVIITLSQKKSCNALTISGGDPLEQAPALLLFLKEVRDYFDDILVYTGFTMDEIKEGKAGAEAMECLSFIDVLIDGRYDASRNTRDCILRGSSNQKVIFLNKDKESIYNDYMKNARMVETFQHEDKHIIVGILNREEHEE